MQRLVAGRDFPSRFVDDNIKFRRSVGNWFDPDSLITGAELKRGFTYKNSKRGWLSVEDYHLATEGQLTREQILMVGPRVFLDQPKSSPLYARTDERTR